MTCYVDDMRALVRGMIMCHMIAPTDAELHKLAEKIELWRGWFDRDHYDLSLTKRALAIAHGARPIPIRVAAHMMSRRRRGLPMGTPEDARADMANEWTSRGLAVPAWLFGQEQGSLAL